MSRAAVLSDVEWARIAPLKPSVGRPGRPFQDHRRVLEGIIYRYRAGNTVAGFAGVFRVVEDGVQAPPALQW